MPISPITTYLAHLRADLKTGDATERTHYPTLKELIESLAPGVNAIVSRRPSLGFPRFPQFPVLPSLGGPATGVAGEESGRYSPKLCMQSAIITVCDRIAQDGQPSSIYATDI